jgi:hypothetical protein
MKLASDWIRITGGRRTTTGIELTVSLHWWTLEGVRTWVTCWRQAVSGYGVPAWHPRALWALIKGFHGWGGG